MPGSSSTSPVVAGAVFGFGLAGLLDGIVLHEILRWHHLVSDDTTAATVHGLQVNILADGVFHAATVAVLVAGVVLLWHAAASGASRSLAVGGVAIGWGAFHLVDEVVFHALLDLHHIRMVGNYLAYDLGFAAIGVTLVAAGLVAVRRARASRADRRAEP